MMLNVFINKVSFGRYAWGILQREVYRDLNFFWRKSILPDNLKKRILDDVTARPVKSISVVIATKDRAKLLCALAIPALLNSSKRLKELNWEIIIVDNSDSNNEYQKIKQSWQDNLSIKIFHCDKPGAAASRNLGIKQSSGEVVAFIDDDCVVDTSWLERIEKFYNQSNYIFGQGQIYDKVQRTNLVVLQKDYERMIYAGNLTIRKDVFNLIDFNESMTPYGSEDWDLANYLLLLFAKNYYFDEIPITHLRVAVSEKAELKQREKSAGKMKNVWLVNKFTLQRNLNIDSKIFFAAAILKEFFFSPVDLFLLKGSVRLWWKNKIRIFKFLKSIKKFTQKKDHLL